MSGSFEAPEVSPPAASSTNEANEVLQVATRPVSFGFQVLLGLAHIAFWFNYPVSTILLPAQVVALDPLDKVVSLGIITTVGAIAAVLGNPIAGALSDRTTSRWGRRRPWMLIGALVSAAAFFFMANATTILILALGWALAQFFGNALLAALAAVIPDRIPERQRGTVSALVALAIPLSIIIGAILVAGVLNATKNNLATGYYVVIIPLIVIIGFYLLIYREKPLPASAVPPFNLRQFLASFWINPRLYPDFGYAWITRFLVILGYAVGTGYLNFYLRDVIHYTKVFPGQTVEQGAATLQVIAAVCIILSTIVFGILSDRFQRRKIFVMGSSVVIALGLLLLALVHSWFVVELANAIIGLGFGAYLAVDIALVTLVLPRVEDRGKDLGVINIANACPQFIAPTIGAIALSIFVNSVVTGYTVLFIVATVLVLLGAILVQPIKGVR